VVHHDQLAEAETRLTVGNSMEATEVAPFIFPYLQNVSI